jgi:hypothetical protein
MSATTGQTSSIWPDQSRRNGRLHIAVSFLAALIMLACSVVHVTVTKAPAEDLSLTLSLIGAFTTTNGPVELHVSIQDPSKGGNVMLSGGQRLTCDGVSDHNEKDHPWQGADFLVPRQPPGGAYTCDYADERGQRTTLTLPVPVGRVVIVSPTAGAHVPIPQPPTEPTATAAATPVPSQPSASSLVIHFTFPSPPGYTAPPADSTSTPPVQWSEPYATIFVTAGCAAPPHLPQQPTVSAQNASATSTAGGTPASPGPACAPAWGDVVAPTGTYVMSSMHGMSYRFPGIRTGPGWIQLHYDMHWLAPAGGFKYIEVATYDDVVIPITWI